MLRKKIGIDLDDVVIDFNAGLCTYHNTLYGTAYGRQDIVQYELERLWGCTPNEAIQRVYDFYHSEYHANLLLVERARESLERLRENNSLVIVTSRPESVQKLTIQLLERHFPPQFFEDIRFLGLYHGVQSRRQTKGEVCRTLDIGVFVEDSFANAASVAREGISVLLFDTPWNQGDVSLNITRVFGWNDALAKLLAL